MSLLNLLDEYTLNNIYEMVFRMKMNEVLHDLIISSTLHQLFAYHRQYQELSNIHHKEWLDVVFES